MSNKAELLKKVKALVERGYGGEKDNAEAILARLMEKYGIEESELEEGHRETAWFPYSQETERRLLNQIIYMVTGKSGFGCVGTYTGRKRKKMGADCTTVQKLEIEANFSFFKVAFEEELEVFYLAFANKNELFPRKPETELRGIDDLSPDEKEKYLKAGLMMEGMERHTMLKQLEAGERSETA